MWVDNPLLDLEQGALPRRSWNPARNAAQRLRKYKL